MLKAYSEFILVILLVTVNDTDLVSLNVHLFKKFVFVIQTKIRTLLVKSKSWFSGKTVTDVNEIQTKLTCLYKHSLLGKALLSYTFYSHCKESLPGKLRENDQT